MKKSEFKLISQLLNEMSDEYSNHGCNDLELDNTQENKDLIISAIKWNANASSEENLEEEIVSILECKDEKLITTDFLLMDYLAYKCANAAKKSTSKKRKKH